MLFLSVLLLAAIGIVFGRTVSFDFVNYDDPVYVTANLRVTAGLTLDSVRWALTSLSESNWHPLTWLSLMLDAGIGGARPGIFHTTNVLFHAASTLLLFLALERMTHRTGRSSFVAALFAIHPLHVESVAWIAERKDVLSGVFWMLTLLAWARYAKRPGLARYLTATACFALGLMAKPMLVSLPFVLLLLDYWPLGRIAARKTVEAGTADRSCDLPVTGQAGKTASVGRPSEPLRARKLGGNAQAQRLPGRPIVPRSGKSDSPDQDHKSPRSPEQAAHAEARNGHLARRERAGISVGTAILEKVPLLAMSAVSCVVTLVAQARGGALTTSETFPFFVRAGNALHSAAAYLGETIWPAGLAVFYPHQGTALSTATLFVSGIVLAAIALAAIATARRSPFLLVGWGWYLISIIPVIGLVQVGLQARADRYTYLPLIGIFVMIAWGVPAVVEAIVSRFAAERSGRVSNPAKKRGDDARTALGVEEASLGAPVRGPRPGKAAEPAEALESERIRGAESSKEQRTQRWVLSADESGPDGAKGRRPELSPLPARALGVAAILWLSVLACIAFAQAGHWRDSVALFSHTIEVTGPNPIAENSLGMALHADGRAEEAVVHLRRAIAILPDYTDAHLNLGSALVGLGKTDEAISFFREAARNDPSNPSVRAALAAALDRGGRLDEAIAEFREVARLVPADPGAHARFGRALMRQGARKEAISALSDASRLAPGDVGIESDLGLVLLQEGRFAQATAHLTEAVRLGSAGSAVRSNLGLALARSGRKREAIEQLEEAVRIDPEDTGARVNLGLVLLDENRLAEAEKQFAEAARLDPNDPDAQRLLSLARQRSGPNGGGRRSPFR